VIRLRTGTVRRVLAERPGAVELAVEVEDEDRLAIAYPAMTGDLAPGDRVLLNTTAVALGLGTGGYDFVVAVEGRPGGDPPAAGRTMKLRYTPEQVRVLSVEEPESPHAEALRSADGLGGTPVVWAPLHSMVAPIAAGAVAAGARRVAYVMTDHAALPAALSRLSADLRRAGLLASVVTAGQAFGGDLEAVTVFTGLLAGRLAADADVLIVGDGPGNTGTESEWGATALDSAMSLNAAAILGGRPIAALRVSFADPRSRHRGVSHHALTALKRVALPPVHVAVPALDDPAQREEVWSALRGDRLEDRHHLVEVTGGPALDLLRDRGVRVESMGRSVADDTAFFLSAGAAGVLAGRMAEGDRAWHTGTERSPTKQSE
jgi:hypothetical protein